MSFGATAILDSFDRTDNPTSLGANWSVNKLYFGTSYSYGILSNLAYISWSGDYYCMYYNPSTYGPNCEVYLTMSTIVPDSIADSTSLHLRVTSPGSSFSGYSLDIDHTSASNPWTISKVVSGTATVIAGPTNQNIANGNKIGFEAIGNQLTGYIDTGGGWTQVLTISDGTNTGAGYLGFYGSGASTAWRFNDFGGGTIVAGGGGGIEVQTIG